MSLLLFEGPAGSGKTTRLMKELASVLEIRPLAVHERVLALTKMHGSRRQLQQRLSKVSCLYGQFRCVTVDSFAWRLVKRWRSIYRVRFGGEPKAGKYEEYCRSAGNLLNDPLVSQWVNKTFPIVIVDEMQDIKEGQLAMIQGLSKVAICLAAADYYQDLNDDWLNPAVMWAHECAEVVELTNIHRTKATGLLQASKGIRESCSVPDNGNGFSVLGALNCNVGAMYVSQRLEWWRAKYDDIAVISPVHAKSSRFVRNLITRVEKSPIGTGKKYGPHHVRWETSQQDEEDKFITQLNLPDDPLALVQASDISLPSESAVSEALAAWLDKQRRIAGRKTFSVAELREQISQVYQRIRAYRTTHMKGVRAMTIHQAKNREFDAVIVLWPYEITGSLERQRRLLYNAITRAKNEALVVVQNPERLEKPPFVADAQPRLTAYIGR
jgi:hypothetical protein